MAAKQRIGFCFADGPDVALASALQKRQSCVAMLVAARRRIEEHQRGRCAKGATGRALEQERGVLDACIAALTIKGSRIGADRMDRETRNLERSIERSAREIKAEEAAG